MKRYSGTLAKPFSELRLGFGAIASQASFDRVRRQIEERRHEKLKKLLLLCDHYEIERNHPRQWFLLALALAEQHVRGLQERRKPGAKQKWTRVKKWELKEAVDRKIADKGRTPGTSVTWACGVLAKQDAWRTLLGKNTKPAEALRHIYIEVCRDIEKVE